MSHVSLLLLITAWSTVLVAASEDDGNIVPTSMRDLLLMNESTDPSGADTSKTPVKSSGCIQQNGSACQQYSLPMAQAFIELANAGQCGPDKGLTTWTCAACRRVGFDVVPESVKVVTGRELFQNESTSVYMAKVKGTFPGNKPRPEEEVKHVGEDCWKHCRQKEGYCDWCGVGNSCMGSRNSSWLHRAEYRCTKTDIGEHIDSASAGGPDSEFGCTLAFRGSKNADNWIMNFVFPLKDMQLGDSCPNCKGVEGWLRSWHVIEPSIMSALSSMGCLPGSPLGNLIITGHSFGAAVSTLAMFHLQKKGYNVVQSYNFESTRVGNSAWAAAFKKAFDRDVPLFRVTHATDVVPRVPPQLYPAIDYKHVASEVFFPTDDKTNAVICEESEDRNCADREWWLPALLTNIKDKFRDHCVGPLGEHGSFCWCPVRHRNTSQPQQTVVVV